MASHPKLSPAQILFLADMQRRALAQDAFVHTPTLPQVSLPALPGMPTQPPGATAHGYSGAHGDVFTPMNNAAGATANYLMDRSPQGGDQTDASYMGQGLLKGIARMPYELFRTPDAILQQTLYPAVRNLFSTPNQREAAANPVAAAPTNPFDPNNPMADVMPGGAPQPIDYASKVKQAILSAGGNVTSTYRDVAKQKMLYDAWVAGGKQGNPVAPPGQSMHNSNEAIDVGKTGGMTLEKAKQLALGQLSPGASITESLDEGSHFHIGWRPGGGGPVANDPFSMIPGLQNPAMDPAAVGYRDAALGDLGKGVQAAMQPQPFSGPAINVPTPPTPQMATPTDFTKVNADIQAMHPVADTDKEQLSIRRSAWAEGIGKALMSMSGGEGLGTVLARIGGGALAGAAHGDAEVRARTDKYDEEMLTWRKAVASGDMAQAQDSHAVAMANLASMNQYAMNKWEVAKDTYLRNNQMHVGDTGVTMMTDDGKGGVTGKFVPFQGPAMAGYYSARARLNATFAGDTQQGAALVDGPMNAIILGRALTAGQGRGGFGVPAAEAPAFLAGQVVGSGQAADLFGGADSKSWKAIQKEVSQRTGIMPGMPLNKDQQDRWDSALIAMIAKGAYDPKAVQFRRQLMSAGSLGASVTATQNLIGGKEKATFDSRGRSSSQTTYPGMTTNPFEGM